jgi:hypothetical protein
MLTRSLVAALSLAGAAHAQLCEPVPLHTSDIVGTFYGSALLEGASGEPPTLYIRGNFARVGAIENQVLLRWSGGGWAPVDDVPFTATPWNMVGGRDEHGPAIYMQSGHDQFHRFDGAAWTSIPGLPPYFDPAWIRSMALFDRDGDGPLPPRLQVLRSHQDILTAPGGATYVTGNVYEWDGQWTLVAAGVPDQTLIVYDPDGDGPLPAELYASGIQGLFTGHYGNSYSRSLVRVFPGPRVTIASDISPRDMAVYTPGNGPALLVIAGQFGEITQGSTSVPARNIAAWDGQSWRALGDGLGGDIRTLTTFDPDGAGPQGPLLLAGGSIELAPGQARRGLVAWDGEGWSDFGNVGGTVSRIQAFHDDDPADPGPALLISVQGSVDGQPSPRFATWRPSGWRGLMDGPGGPINVLAVFNEGAGRLLFAAGRFERASGTVVNNIARWDGQSWSALGTGIEPVAANPNPQVLATAVHHDGSGWALYIAGAFRSAGGAPVFNIARWDGQQWRAVGNGLGGGAVRALAVHDADGPGPLPARLYAAGAFTLSGARQVRRLAVWDGARWSEVAGGVQSEGAVRALRSWDDGSGPALSIGGDLMTVASLPQNLGFRLVGGSWEALPIIRSALPAAGQRINAWATFNDGHGERIYAVGRHAFGTVARLESGGWHQMPIHPTPYYLPPDELFAARSLTDCRGQALYAGHFRFTRNGGRLIDPFPDGRIHAISPPFDDGHGESIFIAGDFTELVHSAASGTPGRRIPVSHIVRTSTTGCYANCDGSLAEPRLNVNDFTCFITRFNQGLARPQAEQVFHYANCDGSTSAPVLTIDDFICFINRFAAGCP